MKFTIVGAGSSYSPELIDEMINRKESRPVKEIVIYDKYKTRLILMEDLQKRKTGNKNVDDRRASNMVR